ncbi:hypothetical protein FSP39_009755, partial [Pinctada imbricata]
IINIHRKKRKKEKHSREDLEEDYNQSPPKKKNKLSDSSSQNKEVKRNGAGVVKNKTTEKEYVTHDSDSEDLHSTERKKRKKKKKDKGDIVSSEKDRRKDSGNDVVHNRAVEDTDIPVDHDTKKKKKMKKGNKEKENGDFSTTSFEDTTLGEQREINENANTPLSECTSKKKKKKKRQKNKDEKERNEEPCDRSMMEAQHLDILLTNDDNKSKKKKKKSKKEKDSEIINENVKGGDDNLTVNKQGSREVHTADMMGKDAPKVGQWGTAAFANDKQQEKFLRLLGGFKAGSKLGGKTNMFEKFTRASESTSDKNTVNCAMNKREEEKYKRNMENQYEKAMSMNLNRGIGLGFDTTSIGKKFHIDKFQSKSMKFDD